MSEKEFSILFLMDESGSMNTMEDEPWQSVNSFVKKQKENNKFNFTLVFFNNEVKFVYKNVKSDEIVPLTSKSYDPFGTTALYDAIGNAIHFQKQKSLENVIFVILTDGLENSSKEYDKYTIRNLISKMESKYNWEFIYLGANQDAFKVGRGLGINNSSSYEYTPKGLSTVIEKIGITVSESMSVKHNDFNTIKTNK